MAVNNSALGGTLLLDLDTWDLAVDAAGNIACASAPYSAAQDAASAVKVFLGEVYYNSSDGVPYFQEILGHQPPLALLKSQIVQGRHVGARRRLGRRFHHSSCWPQGFRSAPDHRHRRDADCRCFLADPASFAVLVLAGAGFRAPPGPHAHSN